MKILFFDDDSRRQTKFMKAYHGACEIIYVTNVKDCLKALEEHSPFDLVLLDHDMDGEVYQPSGPGTGYEVAQYISRTSDARKPRRAVVHSMNEYGAPLMTDILTESNIRCDWYIFNCPEFRNSVEEVITGKEASSELIYF